MTLQICFSRCVCDYVLGFRLWLPGLCIRSAGQLGARLQAQWLHLSLQTGIQPFNMKHCTYETSRFCQSLLKCCACIFFIPNYEVCQLTRIIWFYPFEKQPNVLTMIKSKIATCMPVMNLRPDNGDKATKTLAFCKLRSKVGFLLSQGRRVGPLIINLLTNRAQLFVLFILVSISDHTNHKYLFYGLRYRLK